MSNWRPLLLVFAVAVAASLTDCSSQQSRVVPSAATATKTESLLHSFGGGNDGAYPKPSLVALNSLFFGTTGNGGNGGCAKVGGCGTAYTVDAKGNYTVIATFKSGTDGEAPGQLLLDGTTLYGTTSYGGSSGCTLKHGNTTGCGTIFQLSPSGTETVLYRFPGAAQGALPASGLTKLNGLFYGETAAGGKDGCYYADQPGCGLIYSVTKSGEVKVIYSFAGGIDASSPVSGLTAYKGDLYGTGTAGGRNPSCGTTSSYTCGAVFKVTTSGTETVLHRFTGTKGDGAYPDTALVLLDGKFYGTTATGGTQDCAITGYFMGCGTVFEITPSGTERTIHNFGKGSDGRYPTGLFVLHGVLYGTTAGGGDGCEAYACGTFFKMTPSGHETILYSFPGKPNAAGPSSPFLYQNGTFYGVSQGGGSQGLGTVFGLTL
jgi:hypothetical protein